MSIIRMVRVSDYRLFSGFLEKFYFGLDGLDQRSGLSYLFRVAGRFLFS